ncbi:MAG: glutamate-1-semialdehyde 2,1-aminomutase [Candidatus Omnitrophica bacterium]|nr:glutamate-1-semialdehyde 2,1-aminomutase [Candidatus Omnitrophota bacterium]
MSVRSSEFGTLNGLNEGLLADRVLVGGVNSPVRAFRQVGGEPVLLAGAKGATVRDDAGRTYVDFIMGWGAQILGHNPPAAVQALRRQLAAGALVGLTHPAEARLAAMIADVVPSVEQLRFTVSGTEACMTAVKIARAHAGRSKVLVFDGCYHGHGESLMAGKSAGLPNALSGETVSVPYNDVGAAERAIERFGQELAAVIVEPVAANMGVVAPEPRFLMALREFTSQRNIVLIFDEVVTGFRLGYGSAQSLVNVQTDLTTFGKIIGGGLPIGAVGGPRRLMQHLAPEGDVYHGGTFAGHPLSMAAGLAVLSALKQRPPYQRLERLSQRLADGLAHAARDAGVPIQVNRAGSMLTVFFSDQPVRNAQQAKASRRERFAQWANALRRGGFLIPPSPFEALFLSTAHTNTHIDRMVRASRGAFAAMR